jgi:hypothetical protein
MGRTAIASTMLLKSSEEHKKRRIKIYKNKEKKK